MSAVWRDHILLPIEGCLLSILVGFSSLDSFASWECELGVDIGRCALVSVFGVLVKEGLTMHAHWCMNRFISQYERRLAVRRSLSQGWLHTRRARSAHGS